MYVQGCRCEGCTYENMLYFVAYRNRGSTSVYSEAGDKELRVTCWCERDRKMKLVSADDIVAGKTWSCGREGCEPLQLSL